MEFTRHSEQLATAPQVRPEDLREIAASGWGIGNNFRRPPVALQERNDIPDPIEVIVMVAALLCFPGDVGDGHTGLVEDVTHAHCTGVAPRIPFIPNVGGHFAAYHLCHLLGGIRWIVDAQ